MNLSLLFVLYFVCLPASIIFRRDWRTPLKVNIQFKVNKVKMQFGNV